MTEGSYVSFDPGATTGMALWDNAKPSVNCIRVGQFSLDELGEFLDEIKSHPIKVVIVEEFKVFRHRTAAFANNKMEVSQAVGIIRNFARQKQAQLVFQAPNIKSTAERLEGLKVSGSHSNSHFQDAILHGAFYLIRNGLRDSALVRENKKGESV